jgi:flagellar basal-body rod protein FlgB
MPMNEAMIETPLMRGLERVLEIAALRHRVLTENLANVDTPGYRVRDIASFAGEVEQAMAENSGGTEETLPMLTPIVRQVRGLLERPDGNNVSPERESLLLAENQLRFATAVAFLKSEFHRLSLAINGGSNS